MVPPINHSWTLVGLIGAFLDLVLAYILLCASAFAFFASKFLGVFGLYSPYSCNGFSWYLNSSDCFLYKLLVDFPVQKISSVQLAAKSRFPFDFSSVWLRDQVCDLNVKLVKDQNCTNGVLKLEGGASSSSCSGPRSHNTAVSRNALPKSEVLGIQRNRSGGKGKGVLNQKQRLGNRRRGRASLEYVGDVLHSSYNGDGGDAPTSIDLDETTLHGFELSRSFDEKKTVDADLLFIEEIGRKGRSDLGVTGNMTNTIRILEQELEKEQVTRDALYLELEKERAAAATAADEAMTMILRLQSDKAAIEMEARHYQRMVEEKYAYDEEEMDILKEIIVRREREKHYLEKELEAYRRMMVIGYDELESDPQDIKTKWSEIPACTSEDLELMRKHVDISGFTGKKEMKGDAKQSPDYKDLSVDLQGCLENCNLELLEQTKNPKVSQGMTTEAAQTSTVIGRGLLDGKDQEKDGKPENQLGSSLHGSMLDLESNVYDIHVVDDTTEGLKEKSGQPMCSATVDELQESACSFGAFEDQSRDVLSNRPEAEPNTQETHLDKNNMSQEMGDSQGKPLPFDSGTDSLSAIDNERLRIDSEVKRLRERLKVVQEGRESLSISSQHSEGEKVQLQLLEEIAQRLREIQWLTEPGEVARHASLPPLSSKVRLKKRRCRSVSGEGHEST